MEEYQQKKFLSALSNSWVMDDEIEVIDGEFPEDQTLEQNDQIDTIEASLVRGNNSYKAKNYEEEIFEKSYTETDTEFHTVNDMQVDDDIEVLDETMNDDNEHKRNTSKNTDCQSLRQKLSKLWQKSLEDMKCSTPYNDELCGSGDCMIYRIAIESKLRNYFKFERRRRKFQIAFFILIIYFTKVFYDNYTLNANLRNKMEALNNAAKLVQINYDNCQDALNTAQNSCPKPDLDALCVNKNIDYHLPTNMDENHNGLHPISDGDADTIRKKIQVQLKMRHNKNSMKRVNETRNIYPQDEKSSKSNKRNKQIEEASPVILKLQNESEYLLKVLLMIIVIVIVVDVYIYKKMRVNKDRSINNKEIEYLNRQSEMIQSDIKELSLQIQYLSLRKATKCSCTGKGRRNKRKSSNQPCEPEADVVPVHPIEFLLCSGYKSANKKEITPRSKDFLKSSMKPKWLKYFSSQEKQ